MIFFYMFGIIRSVKMFSKVLGVGMNVGPYMACIFYIYIFYHAPKMVLKKLAFLNKVGGII